MELDSRVGTKKSNSELQNAVFAGCGYKLVKKEEIILLNRRQQGFSDVRMKSAGS
jgi:hypothetical protein